MAICPTCNGTGQIGGNTGTSRGPGAQGAAAGAWPGAQGSAQPTAAGQQAAQRQNAPMAQPLTIETNPPIRTVNMPRTGGYDPAIGNPGIGGAWNPAQSSGATPGATMPRPVANQTNQQINPIQQYQNQPRGIQALASNIRR